MALSRATLSLFTCTTHANRKYVSCFKMEKNVYFHVPYKLAAEDYWYSLITAICYSCYSFTQTLLISPSGIFSNIHHCLPYFCVNTTMDKTEWLYPKKFLRLVSWLVSRARSGKRSDVTAYSRVQAWPSGERLETRLGFNTKPLNHYAIFALNCAFCSGNWQLIMR